MELRQGKVPETAFKSSGCDTIAIVQRGADGVVCEKIKAPLE
jgi:hypothetical protein